MVREKKMLIIISKIIHLGLKKIRLYNWKPSEKVDILPFFTWWI